ncbi:MAG: response regulator, partial [Pseudomonadota bacterium]
ALARRALQRELAPLHLGQELGDGQPQPRAPDRGCRVFDTLESAPGKGSVFRVRLMLPRIQHAPRVSALSAQAITGYEGPRRQVLVVDDNPEHRLLVRDVLAPIGFKVAMAETGSAATAMIDAMHPDILLVDVALPGEDGWHLVKRLRREHGVTVPIMMVSAHAMVRHRVQPHEAMHDAFIPKPIKIDELLATIGRLLDLDWSYRAGEAPVRPVTSPAITLPDETLLLVLRQAVSIHHAKGVRDALETLATAAPDCGDFTREAGRALDEYDFARLSRLIEGSAP